MAFMVALTACGGDSDSAGPSHPFPAVEGSYSMQGTFNGIPANVAFFNGTMTLTQASRDAAPLGGTSNITASIDGSIFNFANSLINASVSPTGVVTFTIADASGTWTFTGNLSGTTITGQHSMTDGSQTFPGSWSATKASSASAAVARAVSTSSIRELVSSLSR
jgi:hypothetical protein